MKEKMTKIKKKEINGYELKFMSDILTGLKSNKSIEQIGRDMFFDLTADILRGNDKYGRF